MHDEFGRSTAHDSPKRPRSIESAMFLVGAAIFLTSAVLWADKPPTMEKTDFSVTYTGSRMVYLGMGPRLYDVEEQRRFKSSLLKDAEPLIYEHPPFEALLLAPLGALPYRTAYLIWGLVNVVVWLMLPFLLRPFVPAPRDDLAYFGLWLLFAPLWVALLQGQSSMILLLLFALAYIQLKRGNDFEAGLILALGLFKFQFVIPCAVIFLLRAKWRFVQGFAVTAVVLGVLSFLAVGWGGMSSYYHLLTSVAAHPENSSYGSAVGMATLQGFSQVVLGKFASKAVIFLIVAGISGFLIVYTAWHWHKANDTNSAAFDLMFAASIVVSLLVGFHMFTHDLSPIMISMLMALAHFPGRSRMGLRLVLGLTLLLLWIPAPYIALLIWHSVYLWFLVLLAFAFAVLKLASEPVNIDATNG